MTTLTDRMNQLERDMRSLSNSQLEQAQVEKFETRATELRDLSRILMINAQRTAAFRDQGIEIPARLAQANALRSPVDDILTHFDQDPRSILEPDPDWHHSTQPGLRKLSGQVNADLRVAWQKHVRQRRPNVDQLPLEVLQNLPAFANRSAEIKTLIAKFDSLAQTLPSNDEEFNRPVALANEINRVIQDIPLGFPQPVRELLEAINQGTANAEHLTEEAIQWLRDNNILADLRISWR